MGEHWRIASIVYASVAALFLIRNTYRWVRWERHWPGARLWTLPLRSAFWPVAWIGLDWSPVRWAWNWKRRKPSQIESHGHLWTDKQSRCTYCGIDYLAHKCRVKYEGYFPLKFCPDGRPAPPPSPPPPPKIGIELSAKDNLSDALRGIADLIPQTMTVLPAGYKFAPPPAPAPDIGDCPCYRCQSQGAHHTTYEVYAKAGVGGDGNTIRLAIHVENADSHEDARLAAIALIGKKYQCVGACHIELKETSVELMHRTGALIPCCYRVDAVFRVIPTLREPSQTIQC